MQIRSYTEQKLPPSAIFFKIPNDSELEVPRPPSHAFYSIGKPAIPASVANARQINEASLLDKVASFRYLPPDWDGYGGVPASERATADARSFIAQLPKQALLPKASVAGSGEISLYWDAFSYYLEASLPGNGTYHYFFDNGPEPLGAEDDLLVNAAPSAELRKFLMQYFA